MGVAVNIFLTLIQFIVGWWAQSQALIADSLHSLSDLVADFVVLLANRHSHARLILVTRMAMHALKMRPHWSWHFTVGGWHWNGQFCRT